MDVLRFTRRHILTALGAWIATTGRAMTLGSSRLILVLAPTNLGLRPTETGTLPGTGHAPQALIAAGLRERLGAEKVFRVPERSYDLTPQPGTRIRNGNTIRAFSLELAHLVQRALLDGQFPIVVGGDCSVLLGSLYGARLAGGRGLVHIDGHSDFFHPGNYDSTQRLGSAAGMDLALATGRGEPLLTRWPGVDGPLAQDADVVQVGERNALDADYATYYGDIVRTDITRFIIQDVLKVGVEATAVAVIERMRSRKITRAWLHLDLDVLDQRVMPAVDSPGSPGLSFAQLGQLLRLLVESGLFIGADVAIYDPDLDPSRRYAPRIVETLAQGFAHAGLAKVA
jgi:arginase